MKKLLNVLGVLLALAAVGFGFVSCDNDVSGGGGGISEKVYPSVSDFTAVQDGDTITFRWKVTGISDDKIYKFKISPDRNLSSGLSIYPHSSTSSTYLSYERDGDWCVCSVGSTKWWMLDLRYSSGRKTLYIEGTENELYDTFTTLVNVEKNVIEYDDCTCEFDYTAPSED